MIKYGITELSVIPVRTEPNERSEMTTQVLFGETFQILEETVKWSYIKLTHDNYLGWIDNKGVTIISDEHFESIKKRPVAITSQLYNIVYNDKKEQLVLPPGCTLPHFDHKEKTSIINNKIYYFKDYIQNETDITSLSERYLNCPYLWGGKNPFGIDCSGLVQVIYKIKGISMPRDAHQQVNEGTTVNFISEIKSGDLAFFDDDEGNIIHVGIITNKNKVIHASGKVRIDVIDQQGIFDTELRKYTHKLRVIKRLL